jgi:hypothetical protein
MTLNQVFPSGHRGTGNGIAIGLNRIMGIVSAVVGDAANATNVSPSVLTQNRIFDRFTNSRQTNTAVPIYICAALYIVMAIVSALLPFEPYGRRSS